LSDLMDNVDISNGLTQARKAIAQHNNLNQTNARVHEASMQKFLEPAGVEVVASGETKARRVRWSARIRVGDGYVVQSGFNPSTAVQNLFIYLRRVAKRNMGITNGQRQER